MNANDQYKDKPLTSRIAKKIILDTQWKHRYDVSLNEIVIFITREHENRGGTFESDSTPKQLVETALHSLEDDGHACKISTDRWEFPKHGQRIFGTGNQWVYLYYYDTYKQHALQQGRNKWRCKIGYSENNPEKTVEAQKRAAPEKPTIALLFRTDNPKYLENVIHKSLELCGKRLTDTGNEWFLTNPDEVADFYQNLKVTLCYLGVEM